MYKIDKRVKLTGPVIRRHRTKLYPFLVMQVGHSFAIPDEREAKLVRAAAWAFKKKHYGYDFTVRRLTDGTYRCWRIEVEE